MIFNSCINSLFVVCSYYNIIMTKSHYILAKKFFVDLHKIKGSRLYKITNYLNFTLMVRIIAKLHNKFYGRNLHSSFLLKQFDCRIVEYLGNPP